MPFQRRDWFVQRISWVLMALAIIAALLGLFGRGPLSDAVAGEEGGPLWVEYHRFARFGSPEHLRVHWGPNLADRDGTVRVWVSKQYLHAQQIEHVSPQPESVEVGEDRLVYVFKVEDPAKSGSATFSLTTAQRGRATAKLGLEGRQAVEFWQFIYP